MVLYLPEPPRLDTVKAVYEYYFSLCGDRIHLYRSTRGDDLPHEWNAEVRGQFEQEGLPELYKRRDWGYAFSDAKDLDSWLFAFHGYRPKSEPKTASFFRFDFDWQVDQKFLRSFAGRLAELTPFLSGFGGYYLQARMAFEYLEDSFDRIYAIAQRYWGVEAHNLDVTVDYMLEGYKSVNWLTFIGEPFQSRFPDAIATARTAATSVDETEHGLVLQAEPAPRLGDRNRGEDLPGYKAVARALKPVQITEHRALGGRRWTDDNTMDYLQRFTSDHF